VVEQSVGRQSVGVDAVERIAAEHFNVSPVVRCRDGSVRIVLFYKHKDHRTHPQVSPRRRG
jgi:hypothetical protein